MFRHVRLVVLLLSILTVPTAAQAAFITFGAVVTNLTPGPTGYSFTFGLPINPTLYDFASLVGQVTLTPNPEFGAASLSLNTNPEFLTGFGLDGVTPTELVATGLPPCVATQGPVTCPFPLVTNTFSATVFDLMQVQLSFALTGQFANANFSGQFNLIEAAPAPEPSTLLLLATAGAGVLRARRRP